MLAPIALLVLQIGPFRLEIVDNRRILNSPTDRIELDGRSWNPKTLRLSNGDTLNFELGFGRHLITAGSETVDLYTLRDIWLDGKHDALMGPGKTGNHMRYVNSKGLITPYFSQVFAAGDHALAILDWRWEKAHRFEHLVRIDTRPSLRITPLRPLNNDGGYFPPLTPKLFKKGGRILLLNGNAVEAISPVGTKISEYAKVPSGSPVRLVANRWLLIEADRRVCSFDLQTKQLRELVKWEPSAGFSNSWNVHSIPPAGSTILMCKAEQNSEAFAILRLPSGLMRPIAAAPGFRPLKLRKDALIGEVENDIVVLDPKTFRTIQLFRGPPPMREPQPAGWGF